MGSSCFPEGGGVRAARSPVPGVPQDCGCVDCECGTVCVCVCVWNEWQIRDDPSSSSVQSLSCPPFHHGPLYLSFSFSWSTADLQRRGRFACTATGFMCVGRGMFFFIFFSLIGCYKLLSRGPRATQHILVAHLFPIL